MTHEITEAEQAVHDAEAHLAEAKRKAAHKEFPKWIEPHASHIVVKGDHTSVPMFPQFHIDRDGKVTVKTDDADHEAKALAVKEEPKAEGHDKVTA